MTTTRIDGPGLEAEYTIEPATTLLGEMATLPIDEPPTDGPEVLRIVGNVTITHTPMD